MHYILRLLTLLMGLSLIGCGATLPKVKPYKMDIQQGNVVTSEMLLKLRPGMTKSQVKFIMGTPLLVDSFRTNRWDYFYQLRKQGKIVSQRRVILDFEDDLLKRVRGDVVPKGQTVEDVKKSLEQEASEQQPQAATEVDASETGGNEPEVQPMEAPAIEATENLPASDEAVEAVDNEETPASVLAVPVEPGPAELAPSAPADALTTETVAEPTEEAEAVTEEVEKVVEEVEVMPKEASAPEVKAAPEVPEEAAAAAVPVIEPKPAVESGTEVLTVLPSKTDTNLVFRMDRSLNTKRIIPQEVSTSAAPLQESVVQEVKEAEESLPAEEPSFFERMLEKIGF